MSESHTTELFFSSSVDTGYLIQNFPNLSETLIKSPHISLIDMGGYYLYLIFYDP